MTENRAKNSDAAVIALVGPEATGKSTLANEIGAWLGELYSVRVIHAGKPPATWSTWPIHALLPLLRKKMPALRTSRIEGHVMTQEEVGRHPAETVKPRKSTQKLGSLIYAIRAVCVAWERRQLLVRSRRAAGSKGFIICDRYPSNKPGGMDSARLVVDADHKGVISALYNLLARLESKIYQQIPPPDIVLQLQVSLETAKRRNRSRVKADKEGDGYIESRHQKVRDWHRIGTETVHYIDTEQPLTDTIQSVKKAIESTLND
ncbi:hypothetical protein [Photobacterium sp.]|uniref:hypothetical protein n=1 Tax=Photobacterium sp. TaxID=660 RepID=UPI00299E915C|nr:hypothetical protein [Photobacterium sp.]MDX1301625.1 hypothetical protein [Photobacterium sp.]